MKKSLIALLAIAVCSIVAVRAQDKMVVNLAGNSSVSSQVRGG